MGFLNHMYGLAEKRAHALESDIPETYPPVRSFRQALKPMAIIAEVKYATPAEGDLGIREDPETLAGIYESLGASVISCLTEPCFFKGNLDHIRRIRSVSALSVLMKDFIIDERQIQAGRAVGADAFLLITEMLNLEELGRLYSFGKGLGMDILVEVHSYEGLDKALAIGADIIGVNSRDLSTLKVLRDRHDEMISHIPTSAIKVAESGIDTGRRLKELKEMGYDAALIGRAVVKADTRGRVFLCG